MLAHDIWVKGLEASHRVASENWESQEEAEMNEETQKKLRELADIAEYLAIQLKLLADKKPA